MLDDVKVAMANSAPHASPWCLFPLALTIVFAPLVVCWLCSVTCNEENKKSCTRTHNGTSSKPGASKERASTWADEVRRGDKITQESQVDEAQHARRGRALRFQVHESARQEMERKRVDIHFTPTVT